MRSIYRAVGMPLPPNSPPVVEAPSPPPEAEEPIVETEQAPIINEGES